MYFPSNGSPSPSMLTDAPARSFGLPRAVPSNSAKRAGQLVGQRLRRLVDLGLAAVGMSVAT